MARRLDHVAVGWDVVRVDSPTREHPHAAGKLELRAASHHERLETDAGCVTEQDDRRRRYRIGDVPARRRNAPHPARQRIAHGPASDAMTTGSARPLSSADLVSVTG